jgi:hypothetical protein
MKKFYSLLAITIIFLMQAKAGDVTNFTFAVNNATGTIVFTNTSTLDGQMERKAWWSFGDGTLLRTPALYGAEHHYAKPGNYEVCLKIYSYTSASDSTLRSSTCKTVTLETVCTARFEFKDVITTNPFSHNVTFAAIPSINADKKVTRVCWNFGDGNSQCVEASVATSAATLLSITHTYSQSTTPLATYNACVTITYDGGCEGKYCNTLTLQSPVVSNCPTEFSVVPTSVAQNKSFTIMATGSSKPVQVCWKFGDGATSCQAYASTYTGTYTASHLYQHAGNYEVCASVKYDGGCEGKQCKLVTIPPPPMPVLCSADFKSDAGSVNASEIKFSPVFTNTTLKPVRICWSFHDGSPDVCKTYGGDFTGTYITSHTYEHAGNYEVCMYIKYDGGCEAKKCKVVSVGGATTTPTCTAAVTSAYLGSNTFVFHGLISPATTATGGTYNWNFGDGSTATGIEVKHTYSATGTYQVCVEAKTSAGCVSKVCKSIVVENSVAPRLTLSPNPVSSTLHVNFLSTKGESVIVRIINSNGVIVRTYTKAAVAGSNTWEFDLGSLPIGVYSMVIQSSSQFATSIFFKQ